MRQRIQRLEERLAAQQPEQEEVLVTFDPAWYGPANAERLRELGFDQPARVGGWYGPAPALEAGPTTSGT